MKKYKSLFIAAAGIGLMIVGIYRQEVVVLYEKAIHICLECVGIG
ncbi:MAG TPA: CD1871A family CXXC motif-containing protein [Lachnospiraceae bacterium]|nr:CD1871A family CXXC motif-containing protein [Lachnospiraceae bacterium]